MMAIILIIVSLVFVGFFSAAIIYYFSAEVDFWLRAKKIRKVERQTIEPSTDIYTFQQELLSSSIEMIDSKRKTEFPKLAAVTFTLRAKYFWNHNVEDDECIFNLNWSEDGWLLFALLETEKDNEYVKRIFDERILFSPITIVNQCQCGMVALVLYEKTKDIKYKNYAVKMYEWLKSQDTNMGVLYRIESEYQLVDVVGMAVPFLIKYGELFAERNAIATALKTTEMFIEYGCDKESGIPAFSFQIFPPYIKSGASNWGRGLAWFMIGLAYVDIRHFDKESHAIIKTLETTLVKLWDTDGFFGHFIGQRPRDLSAELPIVYYLFKNKLIDLDEHQILNYSTMCHNGIMYNSSSSNHGVIKYGMPFGPNVLSQAYMIRLISLFNKRKKNVE